MFRSSIISIITLCLIVPILQELGGAQEMEPIKEYVEVTNVELIVRATRDGKPVAGLKPADFRMFENKRPLQITSFSEIHQKIGLKEKRQEKIDKVIKGRLLPIKKRLFLLYFWVNGNRSNYGEMLDHFYEKIYSPTDHVIMIVKNKIFQVKKPGDVEIARQNLDKELSAMRMQQDAKMKFNNRLVENVVRQMLSELQRAFPDYQMLEQLKRELFFQTKTHWTEYKFNNLLSNTKQLLALSDELAKLDMEKWAMIFFQEQGFPHLDLTKMGLDTGNRFVAKLSNQLENFRIKSKQPNQTFFSLRKIKQSFVNGDATFHVLWVNPDQKLGNQSPYFSVEGVFSGWIETFKGISKVTGGEVLKATNMAKAIAKVVEKEDIFYRITYAPHQLKKKKRKIVIDAVDDDLKVFHVKRMKAKGKTGRTTPNKNKQTMAAKR